MSELAQFLSVRQWPCVVGRCNVAGAKWHGKYTLDGARPAGLAKGPYDSEQEACAAVEAAGWIRRPHSPGMAGPHLDPPS